MFAHEADCRVQFRNAAARRPSRQPAAPPGDPGERGRCSKARGPDSAGRDLVAGALDLVLEALGQGQGQGMVQAGQGVVLAVQVDQAVGLEAEHLRPGRFVLGLGEGPLGHRQGAGEVAPGDHVLGQARGAGHVGTGRPALELGQEPRGLLDVREAGDQLLGGREGSLELAAAGQHLTLKTDRVHDFTLVFTDGDRAVAHEDLQEVWPALTFDGPGSPLYLIPEGATLSGKLVGTGTWRILMAETASYRAANSDPFGLTGEGKPRVVIALERKEG